MVAMGGSSGSEKYRSRVQALIQAIDIGMKQVASDDRYHMLPALEEWKALALDPSPAFANLRSLAFLEDAFFTYWNEAPVDHQVETFWKEIAKNGLPYSRRDVLSEVLTRGSIKTDIEYDHLKESLPGHRQAGEITAEDETRILEMLKQFEAN